MKANSNLFVAIDRTSKFALARLFRQATRPIAVQFLEELIGIVPYRIHTILTDNGIQFHQSGEGSLRFQAHV